MTYILNLTNGTQLTQILDGTFDQIATDLTLIGRNSNVYGQYLNENFIYLLENFANTAAPNHPQTGQLWYDSGQKRLKVYDGTVFKAAGGTIVSSSKPLSFSPGDIWIDNYRKQLNFYDGADLVLAGPMYTAAQGLSGFSVNTIYDIDNVQHTIVLLSIATQLIGIFSKDAFTPMTVIPHYSGDINVGFNVSTYANIVFDVTATRAQSLVDSSGTTIVLTADSFVSTTANAVMQGSLTINNPAPLYLGTTNQNFITVTDELFQISSSAINQVIEIASYGASGPVTNIHIDPSIDQIGINTTSPTATLDINGDLRVRGNLTVNGVYASLGLSATITGLSDSQIITTIINLVYPVSDYGDSTTCRLYCTDIGGSPVNFVKLFTIVSSAWTFTS